MQLLFLWHRRPSLTTSEDDGLTTLRNRKLALQFCGCCEERTDAWGNMIVHSVLVEEGHLFLDSTKDTRIARMQTNDKMTLIVVFLHQRTLFFEGHIGRRTDDGSWLVTVRQSLRNQRACI